jgi:hypothetical protein
LGHLVVEIYQWEIHRGVFLQEREPVIIIKRGFFEETEDRRADFDLEVWRIGSLIDLGDII